MARSRGTRGTRRTLLHRFGGGETIYDGEGQSFNGIDQYAYVADNGALDVNKATADFCFCGWTKANTNGNVESHFGKIAGNTNGLYGIFKYGDNIIYFIYRTSTGQQLVATSIRGAWDTDMHHFLVRIDIANSKIYIYVDGILDNTGGTAFTGTFGTLVNDHQFRIGAGSDNSPLGDPQQFANTTVKDVRIYHKDVTDLTSLTKLQNHEIIGDEVAAWNIPSLSDINDTYNLTGVNLQ